MEQLNQRQSQRKRVNDFDDNEYFNDTAEEKELSTQFLQMKKNQLIDLREHSECYCNTSPVFGINSAKYDINLINRICCQFLLTNHNLNQQLSWKANQFVSFKFGDVQLLDIMNFLVGATSVDPFFKVYKTEETKKTFTYAWFDNPEKINNEELPPYVSFFSKLCKINLLEENYSDFEFLTTSGSSSKQAVCNLRLKKIPPTGDENYAFLRSIWVSEGMNLIKTFSCGTITKTLFQL